MKLKTLSISIALFTFFLQSLYAKDWEVWRGPERNGHSSETDWKSNWQEGELKEKWKIKVGAGFSAVSVSEGFGYTTGNANEKDTVFCFNTETGELVWVYQYDCPLLPKYYPGGTHATPVIVGNKLYTFSKTGLALALNKKTGKVIWKRNICETSDIKMPTWGFASSPLILGKRMILNAGDSGVALNTDNGSYIWKSKQGVCGYSTAVPYNTTSVAMFNKTKLLGVDIRDGKVLWEQSWKTRYGENNGDILTYKDGFIVSATHGMGSAFYRLKDNKTEQVWRNRKVGTQINGLIYHNGFLYGFDGRINKKKGSMSCMKADTGEITWTREDIRGSMIIADGKLLITTLDGEFIIAEANHKELKILAKVKAFGGKCWTIPVLANGLVYCRNHLGELVCFDLRNKKQTAGQ